MPVSMKHLKAIVAKDKMLAPLVLFAKGPTDGLFYVVSLIKVDEEKSRAFVRFEDKEKVWLDCSDLHLQFVGHKPYASENDVVCCLCQVNESDEPNEIVLCDVCQQGYHQSCHLPEILAADMEEGQEWSCATCDYILSQLDGQQAEDAKVPRAKRKEQKPTKPTAAAKARKQQQKPTATDAKSAKGKQVVDAGVRPQHTKTVAEKAKSALKQSEKQPKHKQQQAPARQAKRPPNKPATDSEPATDEDDDESAQSGVPGDSSHEARVGSKQRRKQRAPPASESEADAEEEEDDDEDENYEADDQDNHKENVKEAERMLSSTRLGDVHHTDDESEEEVEPSPKVGKILHPSKQPRSKAPVTLKVAATPAQAVPPRKPILSKTSSIKKPAATSRPIFPS